MNSSVATSTQPNESRGRFSAGSGRRYSRNRRRMALRTVRPTRRRQLQRFRRRGPVRGLLHARCDGTRHRDRPAVRRPHANTREHLASTEQSPAGQARRTVELGVPDQRGSLGVLHVSRRRAGVSRTARCATSAPGITARFMYRPAALPSPWKPLACRSGCFPMSSTRNSRSSSNRETDSICSRTASPRS